MRRNRLLLFAAAAAALVLCAMCTRTGGDTPDGGAPVDPPGAVAPGREDPDTATEPADPHPDGNHATDDATDDHAADDHVAEVTGPEALDPEEVPEVLRAAEQFAEVWSTPDPQWPDQVAELTTPALAAVLQPPPQQQVTGAGSVLLDAPEWARVGVPTERGMIVLDVVRRDDGWLVSAVDWHPGDRS